MTNTKNKKNTKQKLPKLQLALYLLIGYFFNFLGLIIAGLWIKFKTKTFRKDKFVALLIGFGIYAFTAYVLTPLLIQPQIDKAFYRQYPDAETVTTTLQQKYPGAKIFVRVDHNTLYMSGTETKTTLFSVQYRSTKELLTSKQMQDIAKQTCSILKSRGKNYDKVLIFSLKYTLPLKLAEVHRGLRQSCKDWETKDFSDVEFSF